MFLAFLAAEKLKNTFLAPLGVGRVEREVFGVFSCPKAEKYDSRFSARGTG